MGRVISIYECYLEVKWRSKNIFSATKRYEMCISLYYQYFCHFICYFWIELLEYFESSFLFLFCFAMPILFYLLRSLLRRTMDGVMEKNKERFFHMSTLSHFISFCKGLRFLCAVYFFLLFSYELGCGRIMSCTKCLFFVFCKNVSLIWLHSFNVVFLARLARYWSLRYSRAYKIVSNDSFVWDQRQNLFSLPVLSW